MIDDLGILHLSDVHYGNPRVEPGSITVGLKMCLPMDKPYPHAKLLLVHGDYFDSDFRLAASAAGHAQQGMIYLLLYCAKHGIILRFLEGTPKHDRKQSANVVMLAEGYGIDVDVKYIDDLSIEYIPSLDINILYVPDERNLDALDTFAEAQALIHSRGLEQVDIVSMHGAWLYQMPIVHKSYHDSVMWATLVKWHIYSGHIHTHSRYLKNVSVGSFGRNFHGEEEQKGMLYTLYAGDECDIQHIVNPCARIFKTLDVIGMDYRGIVELVKTEALPNKSAIRLRHDGQGSIDTTLALLAEEFPQYTWTEVSPKTKATDDMPSALDSDEMDVDADFINLTPENLPPMVERTLSSGEVDLHGYGVDELMELFKEVLDE